MRPKPTDAFEWVQGDAGQALVCGPLAEVAHHLYTTRDWRLGFRRENVDDPWADVARALGVEPARLVRVRQVHGDLVLVKHKHDTESYRPELLVEADIIISDDPSVALAVQTADCVPLLLADARTGAVAAVHAGWRGLAADVPVKALRSLTQEFGVKPSDLIAAIGPAIGPCCYEVGVDVRRRFIEDGWSSAQIERWFSRQPRSQPLNPTMEGVSRSGREGHWFLDGWQAVRDQLEAAGVPPQRVYVSELCTASHADAFWSYRREGTRAGRMAGAIRAQG